MSSHISEAGNGVWLGWTLWALFFPHTECSEWIPPDCSGDLCSPDLCDPWVAPLQEGTGDTPTPLNVPGLCLLRTWEDKGWLCSGGAITCRMRPWNLSSSTAWQPQPKSHPPKLNPNGPQEFCAVTTSVFSFCTKDNNKYWWEEEAHFTHIWARGYFYCFYNKHKYISMHSQTCTF